MLYMANYSSPIGIIDLFSDGVGLIGLYTSPQTKRKILSDKAQDGSTLDVLQQTKSWLDIYFSGNNPSFLPLLRPSGTPFQLEVWRLLKTIPYGQVDTYGHLAKILAAKRLSQKMSARAVGQAVGANPISIIIPCHRVIGSQHNLTGYAGGLDIKRQLLALECNYFI